MIRETHMHATVKDLRFHARELLDRVSSGEEVIITDRGRPCAKLVPIEPADDEQKHQGATGLFGLWKDHEQVSDVDGYVRELRMRFNSDHR